MSGHRINVNFVTFRIMGHCVVALLLVGILSACTAIKVIEPTKMTESIGTEPLLDVLTNAQVGQTIFSQYQLWKQSSYSLQTAFSSVIGGAEVVVTPEDNLVKAKADGKSVFCTEKPTMRNLVGVPIKTACFVDADNEGMFSKLMVPADAVWWSQTLSEPVRYARVERSIRRPDTLRFELIYLGSSGRVIRLAYREYLNDLARPAFSQEVSYDIESFPMKIGFRRAQFEIFGVTGSSLTYKVITPL